MKPSVIDKSVAEFLSNPGRGIGNVSVVVTALGDAKEDSVLSAIVGVNKIFSRHLTEDFFKDPTTPLYSEFEHAWENLVANVAQKNCELSLQTLVKWLEIEVAKSPIATPPKLPESRVASLVEALCGEGNKSKIIAKFVERMHSLDWLNYLTSKALWKLSEKFADAPPSDSVIHNYFNLVKEMRVRSKRPGKQLSQNPEETGECSLDHQELRKYFQYAWINLLRVQLPEKLYIQVLVALDDKKIALFKNPCLMADFLIESYNKGGAVALLALNGLFILIHSYNLELPDFYTKLYALFKPEIFYQKYRARFFFLADVFLSSSHLPAYLVAAFAKKMARLCLTAPTYSQLHVIPFIGNLIIRHATLLKMIHSLEVKDMSEDPFLENESDPQKSRAIESSLWEIKTLQSHWYSKASSKANLINSAFPKMEWDFSDVLEDGYSTLFTQAIKKKYKGAAPTTNYHKPSGLFKHADDKLSQSWLLA